MTDYSGYSNYGPPPPQQPGPYGWAAQPAPPFVAGKVRSTGMCFLWMIVTLGFYSWYYWYCVHDELKTQRGGRGMGGGLALVLAIFFPIVLYFMTPDEVGNASAERGLGKPVSAIYGLWVFLPFVGNIVWFIQVNDALNRYWRSLGAVG